MNGATNLMMNANIAAIRKFVSGPAKDTIAMSFLPSRRLNGSTGTGLAAAKITKGSGEPNRDKVGTVTRDQLVEIAETKKEDLNASDVDAAVKIIAGTARSMGIEVV